MAFIELVQGDITQQPDIDAIVNAANDELAPGGGVAGAIHHAAGEELYEEAKKHAPITPGECVVTKGYDLPNEYVIHCLGPRYGTDEPAPKLLADCYHNAFACALRNGVTSVAFPAISTGAFGYPTEEAARTALKAVDEELQYPTSVERVRFVLYTAEDIAIYEHIRDELGL